MVLAGLAFAGGCATLPEASGPNVLVTFALPELHASTSGGSKRVYHSGDAWQVPLHTRQTVRTFARNHHLVVNDAWPIDLLGVYCVSFSARSPRDSTELLNTLSSDVRSELVQLNAEFVGMTGMRTVHHDDPLFEVQYGEFARDLEALHAVTLGQSVKIGVIDGAVDIDHPDLTGQLKSHVDFVPAESMLERLHGTAVTGVIGAAADNGEGLVGIAPHANIHVFAACTRKGDGTVCSSFSIAQALTAALQERMDIINMSFAGPEDPLLAALIDAAVERDTVIIAAGDPDNPSRQFPATAPGVYAPGIEQQLWFASPERMSTRAGGSYQVFYGTSIAAAGMTGLAALIRAESSSHDTGALLDWLFRADCTRAAAPLVPGRLQPAQLCE